jgi:Na+-driven multidrug efflux pump
MGLYGTFGKLDNFAALPVIAMSMSVSSVAAQNLGTGLPDRAKQAMRGGLKFAVPVGFFFAALTFFFPQAVLHIFTNEEQVIAEGIQYFRFASLTYFIMAFTFSLNGLLVGAGRTAFIMLTVIFGSVLLRAPLAILFGLILPLGMRGVGMATPLASATVALALFIYYRSGKWLKKNLI